LGKGNTPIALQFFEPDPDDTGVGNGWFKIPQNLKLENALDQNAHTVLLEKAIGAIQTLRKDGARIHCITNTVAQNFTANVLLACNTKPSMTVNPDEMDAFTLRADALHINLGTLDNSRMDAIGKSVEIAKDNAKPILLDPVMAHVSPLRAEFAGEIMDRMSIIRGNEFEIETLGIALDPPCCIVKTGYVDEIIHEGQKLKVLNGDPLMAKVIATGCALGALITALSSKADNEVSASLAGLLWFGVAGEIAASRCDGPGSFPSVFLDTLYNVAEETLRERVQML